MALLLVCIALSNNTPDCKEVAIIENDLCPLVSRQVGRHQDILSAWCEEITDGIYIKEQVEKYRGE